MRVLSAVLAVAFVVVVSLLVAELRAEPRSALPEPTGPTLVAHLVAPPAAARPSVRGGASFGAVPSAIVEPTLAEPTPSRDEERRPPCIVASRDVVQGGAADDLDDNFTDNLDNEPDDDADDLDFDGRVPQQVFVDGPHEITVGRRVIRIESELSIY